MESGIYQFQNYNSEDFENLRSKLKSRHLDQEHINALITKPWWSSKHSELQSYLEKIVPGTHLVAVPFDSKSLEYLLSGGIFKIATNNVIFTPMIQSGCHANCGVLLRAGKVKEYHTGYALSRDRLWRYHSWGIAFDGRIVETTEPRLAYLSNEVYNTNN